eukprot:6070664-Prymnesium_polylepis.1
MRICTRSRLGSFSMIEHAHLDHRTRSPNTRTSTSSALASEERGNGQGRRGGERDGCSASCSALRLACSTACRAKSAATLCICGCPVEGTFLRIPA